MRFSRLQKLIKSIWCESLPLQLHCSSYRREGAADIGRYWITLDKKLIWQAPGDYYEGLEKDALDHTATEVTIVLRQYLDCPRGELLTREFDADQFGLVDIMRAADRRIGLKKLSHLLERNEIDPARKVLEKRMAKTA